MVDDITTLGGGATALQVEAATAKEVGIKVLVLVTSTGCTGADVVTVVAR